MSDFTDNFMEFNGAKHYVEVQGNGSAVIFLHAGVADSSMWDGIFEHVAGKYLAVRYDMRGYGQTELNSTEFSYGGDLAELYARVGIDSAVLVGCSFGGQVAIDFALDHRELVSGLVLISPAMRGWSWSEAMQSFGGAEDEALDAGKLDEAVELNVNMWVAGRNRELSEADANVADRVRAMQKRAFEIQLAVPDAQVSFPEINAVEHLDEISCPTLVISGTHDQEDFLQIAHKIDEDMRGSKRVSLMDAAHLVSMERPEAFLEHLNGFLDEVVS